MFKTIGATCSLNVTAPRGAWVVCDEDRNVKQNTKRRTRATRSVSLFLLLWRNETPISLGSRIRNGPTGDQRIECIPQLVLRDNLARLSEACIKIVDTSTIFQFARLRKYGGFGDYRSAGSVYQV